MQQLRGKNLLLVGFTLFSMFFGAGNLIFPPFLGAQAGSATWLAMAGFAVSAIGFPILGVIEVARSGGLPQLAGRVHPKFAAVFTLLIYLSIGPGLAIPRTASTSFEMVAPLAGGSSAALQLVYSLIFFALAGLVALRPEKLTRRLGKILCPTLIALIIILFVACLLHPVAAHYGAVSGPYTQLPAIAGFLGGYETMDTIAALNFGVVIALNIRAMGVEEEREVVRGTIRAGLIAAVLFALLYSMLAHVGALSGAAFGAGENGAVTLTNLVSALFGRPGGILLAAIFIIACFNTCTGLLSCCSEYFGELFPRIPYRLWVAFFAAASMLVSNVGLTQILAISKPILSAIYPAALVLILLALALKRLTHLRLVYPLTVGLVCVESITAALRQVHVTIPGLSDLCAAIPLASQGLGWLLPALAGLLAGIALSLLLPGGKDGAAAT